MCVLQCHTFRDDENEREFSVSVLVFVVVTNSHVGSSDCFCNLFFIINTFFSCVIFCCCCCLSGQIVTGMDAAVGEVIIDNMIYSARYAQPPRAVEQSVTPPPPPQDGKEEEEEEEEAEEEAVSQDRRCEGDACGAVVASSIGPGLADRWSPRLQQNGGRLVTTNLDEPDYSNVPLAPISNSHKKMFTNCYGREENIYEEINELQKRMAVSMATTHWHPQPQQQLEDEVARVHLSHDATLNELNLDLEQFLKPVTPEPTSPPPPPPPPLPPFPAPSDAPMTIEPTPPRPKFFASHTRSNSSVSASQLATGVERTALTRCESLDLMNDHDSPRSYVQRRPSVASGTSTSSSVASGSTHSRSDSRQSLRQLHHGLRQGIQLANQGLVEFSEKCGLLLTKKRNKKVAQGI